MRCLLFSAMILAIAAISVPSRAAADRASDNATFPACKVGGEDSTQNEHTGACAK